MDRKNIQDRSEPWFAPELGVPDKTYCRLRHKQLSVDIE